ncbi:MAG: hypothetical protein RI894_2366 [Bacteroidota bacterium]|jgi:hypothetical protein
MAKKINEKNHLTYKAWSIDQLAKSAFFHQKLHEWKLVELAKQLENVKGETLTWDKMALGISEAAWNKIIHRGIKPIIVFSHPTVLQKIAGATAYYRMLAMVSQKSMNQISGSVFAFENGTKNPNEEAANFLAAHLNQIISHLIESDETIDVREFDIWRGMAAGAQAQGSWVNAKGDKAEILVRALIENYLKKQSAIAELTETAIILKDKRVVAFASEPDIAIFKNKQLQVALEVKGGIDTAAVLVRVGAAIKSLKRAKEENPKAFTVLIMQEVAFSERAKQDIALNKEAINHIFMLEQLIDDEKERKRFFNLLNL